MVVFGQNLLNSVKVVDFGQRRLYFIKMVVFGQSGCIQVRRLCSGSVVIFE